MITNNKLIYTLLLVPTSGVVYSAGITEASGKSERPLHDCTRPNVLIIYTDDMGVGDVSFLNDGWVKTPYIDKLASQGMVVTNYYTAAAVSSPSRAGLTTGIFPLELGINTFLHTKEHNINCEQNDFLDPAFPSMARVFKQAGYTTAHIGKWHMGGGRDIKNAPQITDYGFDYYLTTYEGPDPDPKITATDWIWSPQDEVKRWERTEYFVDKTIEFMKANKDKPFFINLWPDDMHTPYVYDEVSQANNKTWNTETNYRQVLQEYDYQIGRLMRAMHRIGADENTIVIFTSDNGPMPYYYGKRTNGLRSMKCSLYEGGIRMPFIIRWPGKIPEGSIDDTSVLCAVDLFPSLCSIIGEEMPDGFKYSGEDMSQVFFGKPVTRTGDLMWEFGRNEYFYQHKPANKSPHLGIRRGNMKLMINSFYDRVELYDIRNDPEEKNNLAHEYPELVNELRKVVTEWWNSRAGRNILPEQ